MMLMIVDDNSQVRRVIRRICQDLADDFCECADGSEALALYRAEQPDRVVMDVRLEVQVLLVRITPEQVRKTRIVADGVEIGIYFVQA